MTAVPALYSHLGCTGRLMEKCKMMTKPNAYPPEHPADGCVSTTWMDMNGLFVVVVILH